MPRIVHLVVPGSLQTLTGGFVYDRRIVEGLRALEFPIEVTELRGPNPLPSEREALRGLPEDRTLLFDGLSLPHLRSLLPTLRHRCLALVHHPCSVEPDRRGREELARAERAALAQIDGVIATSTHTAALLPGLGVDPAAVEVVHPATDPKPLAPVPTNPRPRLLCVATLTFRKGHDLLLEAVSALDTAVRLDLVGGGGFEPEWAAEICARVRRGVGRASVVLHGELSAERVDALLERADLFVFPSRYEGFGMAPLEAIRRGIPVLSTEAGALPEALPRGAAHFVAPTARDFLRGLEHCLTPAMLGELRRGARTLGPKLPTWHQAALAFRAALTRLESRP